MKPTIKLTTLLAALLLSIAGFSQRKITSTHQQICKWNTKTQKYDVCSSQNKSYKIEINTRTGFISIKYANINKIYKVLKKQVKNDETIFNVVQANGKGSTIKLDSSKKWLKVVFKNYKIEKLYY